MSAIRYEDHQGLVNKLAFRFAEKLMKAGIHSMDVDDWRGEMGIAFVNASQGFDPERGLQFSTYFWQAATNRYNVVASKLLAEQYGGLDRSAVTDGKVGCKPHQGLKAVSFEELRNPDGDPIEFADDTFSSPSDRLEALQAVREITRNTEFHKATKLYLAHVIDQADVRPLTSTQRRYITTHSQTVRDQIESAYGVKINRLDFRS